MEEIWKDIPGYEGKYQVSDMGNVKSVYRSIIRKQWQSDSGYMYVGLKQNGKQKQHRVNILVYESFIGPVPEGMHINHINEDKTDNRLENLNLMTPKQNANWGTRNDRISSAKINGKMSKAIYQYSLDGQLVNKYPSAKEAARETGFDQGFISACARGEHETAYGYIWRYGNPEKVLEALDELFKEFYEDDNK